MRASEAQRLAQRAWKLLHIDSAHAIALAERALAKALERGDAPGEAWARLARGFHLLYFARPRVAAPELRAAQKLFDAQGSRAGHILAREAGGAKAATTTRSSSPSRCATKAWRCCATSSAACC